MTKTFRSNAITLGMMTAIAACFSTSAFAHNTPVQPRAQDFVAHYETSAASSILTDGNFNMAGTRGRLGLGANAVHPEGPGNVSN
jgi:hypothetical protein